ncbi:MAG: hypothetical protein K5636_03080 [Bacteroidales bacterium]|nr:hypothetical protein [Bacteroidales bacterium]
MKKLFIATLLLLSGTFLMAQNSNCPFKYGANEEDSLKCLEQITNFNMFYKSKSYADAYEAWRYLIANCPCCWDGIYTNAQNMFNGLIKAENDSLKREHLIDTLIYSYEIRNLYFPEKFSKGYCLGFKAYNTLLYRSKSMNLDQIKEVEGWFEQSVEMEKENTQPAIWDKYFQLSESITKATKDTSVVIEAYGRATDYLDVSINNSLVKYEKQVAVIDSLYDLYNNGKIDTNYLVELCKKPAADTTRQMKLVENYRRTLAKIENAVTPYASCDVLEELYSVKLANSKDDISAVNKIVMTMAKGECLTSPVFKDALEILHRANPTRTSAYHMGNLSLRSFVTDKDNAEIDAAIRYFEEAVSLSETNEQKADANYMLAVACQTKGSYAEARNAAYAALKAKPNMGKAYILIGDLYANSVGRCSGDDIPMACQWAAADKYAKAVAVDPSCADRANAQRARLRFPSKEDLFKRGLSSGSSYHVGCWIQENTTVR